MSNTELPVRAFDARTLATAISTALLPQWIGPSQVVGTVSSPTSTWRIVDIGVLNMGTGLADTLLAPAIGMYLPMFSSQILDLAGVLVLPEDDTLIINDVNGFSGYDVATYTLDGARGELSRAGGNASTIISAARMELYSRGRTAMVPVESPRVVSGFALIQEGAHNLNVSMSVRVRERFTYFR